MELHATHSGKYESNLNVSAISYFSHYKLVVAQNYYPKLYNNPASHV
jgi:hypothetical protein